MELVKVNRYALKDFMEGEGLRPTDLADNSGVSKGFLSELLSGSKTEASAATLKKLADALGVRVRSLAANPDDDLDEPAVDDKPATTKQAARKPAKAAR